MADDHDLVETETISHIRIITTIEIDGQIIDQNNRIKTEASKLPFFSYLKLFFSQKIDTMSSSPNIIGTMKIAVIGASRDESKYGNKILKDLIKKGHFLYPVNPRETTIEDLLCFANLKDLPKDVEMITFVTPPTVTLAILQEASEFKHTKIWCQPGSSDEKVIEFLETNGFDYIANACVMMENIEK